MALAIGCAVALLIGELLVRFVAPQPSMRPRPQFSSDFGLIAYANRTIVNEIPGQWRFTYSTNALGHRGPLIPLSNRYPQPQVVVLGDSYSFGYGVNDGEEYPAQLRALLRGRMEVVNLGMGGWGLTQEIRRFYELGQLYQPAAVILQFTGNDPFDNLTFPVTRLEAGRFSFVPAPGEYGLLKALLADSVLQHSQLYNLARQSLYLFLRGAARNAAQNIQPGAGAATEWATPQEQAVHGDLLEAFADDLARRGLPLILIGVEGHFERMPRLLSRVQALHSAGKLQYHDVALWLKAGEQGLSPEGHWGPASHRTVAQNLARVLGALPLKPGTP
jgi:hypothetical protein